MIIWRMSSITWQLFNHAFLEADKGQEGSRVGGVGEEMLGDDDLEDVVHLSLIHVAIQMGWAIIYRAFSAEQIQGFLQLIEYADGFPPTLLAELSRHRKTAQLQARSCPAQHMLFQCNA